MSLERLAISADKRFLTTISGAPFFYLGDTDWELFHRCTREEAELLCANRAAKGFNVLQAVALAEIDGINTPNVYGHRPLVNDDPLQPVEEYWKHVDWIVDCANRHGLYVGLLPTWGDKWNKGAWGKGPTVFSEQNARAYGRWIGQRYRNAGVIWIMGGDRSIDTDEHAAIIRAMSEGVKEGDGGTHLLTFHPPGNQSSSKFVNGESWLDFHMIQTGHCRERASWAFYDHDWGLMPHRPFVNGEPPYEAHPNNFRGGDEGWLDQADVRRELYWAICGGACGFTYGCHAIWQMYDTGRDPLNLPRATWKDSLDLPGAAQMQHGKRLALSRPVKDREPANHWAIQWPQSTGADTIRACRGTDGSWMFVYLPNCQRVKLHENAVHGRKLRVTWFNPRTGACVAGGEVDGGREETYQPPFDPDGRDWVLILDDTSKGYALP